MTDLLERIGPVLGFLVALTVVAEICDRAGLFDVAGNLAARLARGRTVALWLLFVVLACAGTIVLSLDTTAVLLTPVALAVARATGADQLLFAFTTVWLANTASLLLPVSNLTNLLAVDSIRRSDPHASYLALAWRPALVAIAVTVLLLAVVFRRSLRRPLGSVAPVQVRDRTLLVLSAVVCAALVPAFVSGIAPVLPATVAALVLTVGLALRDRAALRTISVPWVTVVVITVLFVAIDFAGRHGLTDLLRDVAGSGRDPGDLLRLAFSGVGLANVGNNLPAYLTLEPVAQSADRHLALLVGVNVGPIITPWGSVATLLWLDRCRRADVAIPLGRYVALSALLAALAVPLASLAV